MHVKLLRYLEPDEQRMYTHALRIIQAHPDAVEARDKIILLTRINELRKEVGVCEMVG